jgi:hypothetical protein
VTELVPYGHHYYRRQLRRLGPLVALIPAAVLLAATGLARLVLRCPAAGVCTTRAVTGWLLPALALPTAVPFGLPIESGQQRLLLVVLTSAALWIGVGYLATARATRSAVADWRRWVGEFAWMAMAVWIGVATGVALIGVGVGGLDLVG